MCSRLSPPPFSTLGPFRSVGRWSLVAAWPPSVPLPSSLRFVAGARGAGWGWGGGREHVLDIILCNPVFKSHFSDFCERNHTTRHILVYLGPIPESFFPRFSCLFPANFVLCHKFSNIFLRRYSRKYISKPFQIVVFNEKKLCRHLNVTIRGFAKRFRFYHFQ